jgi:hypothetical protein
MHVLRLFRLLVNVIMWKSRVFLFLSIILRSKFPMIRTEKRRVMPTSLTITWRYGQFIDWLQILGYD